MKSLLVILFYIATAILLYTILSSIAYMFTEYTWNQIVQCGAWQFTYIIFIHWMVCIPTTAEINDKLDKPL